MDLDAAKPAICYLAVYGRCEIYHLRDRDELDAFMRAEMRAAGVDTSRLRSVDRLQDAYISFIHRRDEGPVEWGEVAVEPPIKRRARRKRVADRHRGADA